MDWEAVVVVAILVAGGIAVLAVLLTARRRSGTTDPELRLLERETNDALREAEKEVNASAQVRAKVGALRRQLRYTQRRQTDEGTAEALEGQLYPPLPGPAPTHPGVREILDGPAAPPTE